MSANIICAWCLTVMRADVPELDRDSHGLCERCTKESFSELQDWKDAFDIPSESDLQNWNEANDYMREMIVDEPEPYELEVDPADVGRDDRAWNQEIAREEGMLGGIESFNDWGGSFYE